MPVRKVFEGKVDHVQVLDENGNVDAVLEPKLSREQLEKMYSLMVLTRSFDRKAMSLQRQGRMYTYTPCEGQEGAQIGTGMALKPEDYAFPSYREHGVYIARGQELYALYLYWMGLEDSLTLFKGNDFSPAIPIASQILHAAGAGMAFNIQKRKGIAAVTFFGDGATSEGDFHEGMNFAGVFKAPTVFVCQNNQWAITVSRKQQTASETIAQKALAYGFQGVQADGNDVLAAYKVSNEALEKARNGGGPTLIEFLTYRMGPHSTADDPTKYRKSEEPEAWKARDPIARLQKYLQKKGIWSPAFEEKVQKDAVEKIEAAVKKAEEWKADPESVLKFVYKEMPASLKEQLEELRKRIP